MGNPTQSEVREMGNQGLGESVREHENEEHKFKQFFRELIFVVAEGRGWRG